MLQLSFPMHPPWIMTTLRTAWQAATGTVPDQDDPGYRTVSERFLRATRGYGTRACPASAREHVRRLARYLTRRYRRDTPTPVPLPDPLVNPFDESDPVVFCSFCGDEVDLSRTAMLEHYHDCEAYLDIVASQQRRWVQWGYSDHDGD
jgi:hypothetical protein